MAEAVVSAPAARWWARPMTGNGQYAVAWPGADAAEYRPPGTTGTQAALAGWREDTLAAEARAARESPADPRAPWSGNWWSTPGLAGLVVTSRLGTGIAVADGADRPAPVGLVLVEDELGWETARTWAVQPPATARVLELTGPDDWTALDERYPLEVSASRRHDWWRVTGWEGAWAIPDWAAVAAQVDAVHLTVDGYLATAGRALPVDVPRISREARTLLGG